MRVLAIDASLRNTGVAIVDANNGKPQSVYFGTIHNKSAMRPSSCLVCIRDRLAELIREHAPDCCALESVIYVQSYKTAIILGAARGAAILAAAENGLPVFEYSPKRIKQSAVGRGGAGKNQVAFMVRALLGLTETPDADVADAPTSRSSDPLAWSDGVRSCSCSAGKNCLEKTRRYFRAGRTALARTRTGLHNWTH